MPDESKSRKITYADSGVDIDAGDQVVERIKHLTAATFNKQVLAGIGSFGAFFKPDLSGFDQPVLVSSTDSVGTKVKLAFMTGRHNTVGEDLVNHCVNDILVHGAKPLYFLDYIGIGKVKPDTVAEIVSGLSRACREAGMALPGGETAEMSDMYQPGEYDLVGFIVGVVEQERIIDGSAIKEGDICLGLPSDGLHTNGYTLARKVAFEIAGLEPDNFVDELQSTIADALLAVHRSYAPIVHHLLTRFSIHGMAHITGGGIPGNLSRVMPKGLSAEIRKGGWPVPPIFRYLEKAGNIDPVDIYRTFNMGIGYILVVNAADADAVEKEITARGESVFRIGRITGGAERVVLVE